MTTSFDNLQSSIVISVYQDEATLRLILDSLQKQTVDNFEVIISEDGQSDAIKKCVNDYLKPIPGLKHLSQEDDGFRKTVALNRAIRSCSTDHLIFIDGDCVPHPAFIAAHQTLAAPGIACTGRRAEIGKTTSEKLRNRSLAISSLTNRFSYLLNTVSLLKDKTKNIECGLYSMTLHALTKNRKIRILGSNFSCDRQDLIKINGFNEDYLAPGIGEDSDIDWRLRKSGVVVKNVKFCAIQYHLYHVKHYHPSETNMAIFNETKRSDDYLCQNGLEYIEK